MQLALRRSTEVHDEMHSAVLHYKLHGASGISEPIDIADRQDTRILKAGQDLGGSLALGRTDEENVTVAHIIAETRFTDDAVAPLDFLSRRDTPEIESKLVITSHNFEDNRRFGTIERAIRPLHEFRKVE